ncbi:hypothetical protein AGMMS49940_06580 [Spirochaetia bacterium]|nr:hypothetical protein AGMMS49940_06580 [Spirochaetia bacterium]
MTKKPALLLVTVFWTINMAVFSQTSEPVDESSIVYYIRAIDCEIIGRTRKFALLHVLDLKEGQRITGKPALEALVNRKTQDLRNERVLKDEETRIDYTIGEAGEDGLVPVDILVHTEDSWNIIAFPEPKFTAGSGESSGFSLILKARDYNFLGTMAPLRVSAGFGRISATGEIFVPVDIDADIPFIFLGKYWNFNFDNKFNFPVKSDDPLQYTNVTGLSVELPWKKTTFTVGFDQSLIVNEENSDMEKDETGENFFDNKWYMNTVLYAGWNIPLGIEVGNFGELIYNAGLSENFKYRPGGDIGDYRWGPVTGFSHRIGFGEIDWIGNFRRGLNVSLSNSINYNLWSRDPKGYGAGKEHWEISFSPTVTGHFLPLHFLGIYGRLKYTQLFNFTTTPVKYWGVSAGEYLRGVPDDELRAKQLFSLNLELPLGLPLFTPSTWFNSRYYKPFNLEFHISPFVDLALMDGTDKSGTENYGFKNLLAAAGVELYIYSLSWRSLYFRFSFGWDLREWSKTGNIPRPEIFLGMERFFENIKI